ncbi:uncharacterized protein LOC125672979 isoform X4 [Ostrea edulis]|uniref:uncharacterized protein LOC125672979 isoform X4 n=1 Tax=Ostrea edulis TaxID=37623 RepID=UPI0024AF7A02|nr:uncharacterized protein LOC125672979 isoform X4 [Ostrea edulis]
MSMLTVKEYVGLLLVVLLIEISCVNAFTKPCNASLQTVSMVTECPTNQSSYEAAAGRKNCQPLLGQGSGCESLQYHCVLSEDLNSLVEVCAPSLNIIGHVCTMFSSKERSVKRIDDLSCKNVTGFTECPYSYNSTSAYKYQQCYTKAHSFFPTEATQSYSSSSNPTTRKKDSQSSSDLSWIGYVFLAVAVVGVSIISFLVWRRYKRAQPNNGIVRWEKNTADAEENRNDELDGHGVPLLRVNIGQEPANGGTEDNDNRVEAKLDVSTESSDMKEMLKLSTALLIQSLKNPDETWTTTKIIYHVENLINQCQDARETTLLVDFIKKINEDVLIQNTLIQCGPIMLELISSVQERYKATKVLIKDGCVCFIMCFAECQDLQNFVTDLQKGNNDFTKDVSRILMNPTFLSVFDINSEVVTWKATEIKVYKASKEGQSIQLESPLAGTYRDTFEDDNETGTPVKASSAPTDASFEDSFTSPINQHDSPGQQKERKSRSVYTKQQKDYLEKKYQAKKKPFQSEILEIANETGLSITQVNTWFQNRRAKEKKLQKKTSEDDKETNADETIETEFDNEESHESFASDGVSDEVQYSKQSKSGNKQSATPSYKHGMEDEHEDEIDVVHSESEGASKEGQSIQLESPLAGTYRDTFEDDNAPINQHDSPGQQKERKMRSVYTKQQKDYLEKRFQANRYPSKSEIFEIANETGLSITQVNTWFQNRRAKEKRLQKKTSEDDKETNADETIDTEFDNKESHESFASDGVSDEVQCSKQSESGNKQSATPVYKPYQLEMEDEDKDDIDVVHSESEGDKSTSGEVEDAFHSETNQYPAYRRVRTRALSFNDCEYNIGERRNEFARSGFFYEGLGKTSCFHCGIEKTDWKDSDDILKVHLTIHASCEYVKYIQSLIP